MSDVVESIKFSDWTKVEVQGQAPSPRYAHVCAIVNEKLYLYGGNNGSTYLDDMYCVDLSGEEFVWSQVATNGVIPSAREAPTLSAIDDELFLYGGLNGNDNFSCIPGLHVFKTKSNTWASCDTTGPAPKALSLTANSYGTKLVFFGGVLDGEPRNDVTLLDTITLVWSSAEVTGTPPPRRCDHSSVIHDNHLIVTAGSGSDTLWFNDLHTLDLNTMNWACPEIKGIPPTPRDCTSLNLLLGQYLVLFGGFNGAPDEKCFNDMFTVDLSSKFLQWENLSIGNLPSARYSHTAITIDKKIFVLYGQDLDQELSDVWLSTADPPMIGYEPVPIPRVRYSTGAPIPCPRKPVTPAPPKTPKPRDFEELRTGYIKRINEMFDSLSDKYQQLDSAVAQLESERNAFEMEKKSHSELYDRQQQELKEMMENHRIANEAWLEKIKADTEAERRELARERASLEKNTAQLASDQEEFAQKSKKLDAIMKQVQGLSS